MLLCPYFALTWHTGVWPVSSGAIQLLGAGDYLDEGSPLPGQIEAAVQRADFVRGVAPGFFPRGGAATSLDWETVRQTAAPSAALVAGLDAAVDLPLQGGWLQIDVPDEGRSYALVPAAVRAVAWRTDPRKRLLRLRWRIDAGPIFALASDAPDHALTTETGFAIGAETGEHYLALETAPDPE